MLGVALLVCASTAAALSLGRARGAVLVGRSLDLTVQTTLDAQEPLPEASCLAVDVFYGDVRVSQSSVSISAERSAAGESRIRIRASTAVDEPVVTLYLRSSCGASVSRRYVLLADALSDSDAIAPTVATPVQIPRVSPPVQESVPAVNSTTTAPGSAANASNANSARAQRAARRQAQRQTQPRLEQDSAEPRAEQSRVVGAAGADSTSSRSIMRPSSPRKSSGARLQVDLLDLASYEPSLRSSNELASAPSEDAAVRSQAQALWRSLNTSAEDAMRDTQRLDALGVQMRASLEQSKRQGQEIAALSTQLQLAQKERYLNPFTIFLGLLTLLALVLSAWLWRRGSASDQPWYRANTDRAPQDEAHLWQHMADEQSTKSAPLVSAGAAPAKPSSSRGSTTAAQLNRPASIATDGKSQGNSSQTAVNTIDFLPEATPIKAAVVKAPPLGTSAATGRGGSMGRVDSTPPAPLLVPTKASVSRSGFGNSDFATSSFLGSRVVAAEELFDIQEQADFFMSLGQPEQAIEVLKNHITDNVETSALAYMDLFDIYHRTNRQQDYQELRNEFNRVFNAQAPGFELYGHQNNGLESYPVALESIQRYWPGPQTLDVIEESIFRQPDSETPPFDMLAYRELMLLYTLAKELNKPGASFMPVQAIAPVAALSPTGLALLDDEPDSGQIGLPRSIQANESLGLDLSLSSPDELKDAIARDATMRIPALDDEDLELDFDLSDAADLPVTKINLVR